MANRSDSKKKKPPIKQQLGELLVEDGIINKNQLKLALKRQNQVGGHIGSVLIEMGFMTIDNLLNFLSQQLGVPSVNLFRLNIDQKVLNLIPFEKITSLKILPIVMDENTLTLAMANPQDFMTISEIEFALGKKVQPVVAPSFMMESAMESLRPKSEDGLTGEAIEKAAKLEIKRLEAAPSLESLLERLVDSGGSDMLLTAGAPPSIRITNEIERLQTIPLSPADCEKYAIELMSDEDWDKFLNSNDHDFAVTFSDIGRFRVNVYRQRNSVSIAIRPIVDKMPSLKKLNLPEWIKDFVLRPQGLILVSGPAGHGKTTTLSAMVDIINSHRKCNIVTLEDPIEYLHNHKKSNINQREIGRDTDSFYEGTRHIFRQSPDVILIGEMRDKETFEIALRAANTGHLVLSTAHSNNATSIIENVINMFPPHHQNLTRMMLADSLLLSISQRLIPLKNSKGRILALEKLVNSFRIRNLIRDGKTHQIRSQIQAGAEDFRSIDVAVSSLCNEGWIAFEEGINFVEDKEFYRELASESIT